MPWARDPAINFLVPPEQVRTLLHEAAFEERVWLPLTPDPPAPASAATAAVSAAGTVVNGPDAPTMEANARRNQAEQRIIYLRAVCVRR